MVTAVILRLLYVCHSVCHSVQVDVGCIRTVKRPPLFTRYFTRRTVDYLSESESVCFGRISSETAERIWQNFSTEIFPDTASRILGVISLMVCKCHTQKGGGSWKLGLSESCLIEIISKTVHFEALHDN